MDIPLGESEAKATIKRHITKEWQHSWDTRYTGWHLHAIQWEEEAGRTVKEALKRRKF